MCTLFEGGITTLKMLRPAIMNKVSIEPAKLLEIWNNGPNN